MHSIHILRDSTFDQVTWKSEYQPLCLNNVYIVSIICISFVVNCRNSVMFLLYLEHIYVLLVVKTAQLRGEVQLLIQHLALPRAVYIRQQDLTARAINPIRDS